MIQVSGIDGFMSELGIPFGAQVRGFGINQHHLRTHQHVIGMTIQKCNLLCETVGQANVIRIHPRDQLTPSGSDAIIQCADDSSIRTAYNPDPAVLLFVLAENGKRRILRSIIHRDQFKIGKRLGEAALHGGAQKSFGVVDGHHN